MLLLILFVLILGYRVTVGLNNGVALIPPMGWNPYNVYSCYTDEDHYRAAAQALVNSGLGDLGYKYLNLDCGWQATFRLPSGAFTWDTTRIQSGIPALADYVHGLGLLFGLYSDAGYYSCDPVNGEEGRIGSLGYELSDAATFAEWGVDYLKYDNCFAVSPYEYSNYDPPIQEEVNYVYMREALSLVNRNIVYSICEWGVQDPARWAGGIGNSWRISNGVDASFESLKRIVNQLVPITQFARPGAWNDLDLLEVGNDGLTQAEWAMQFAFWAAAKSPLLISTDLSSASAAALSILGNEGIIAVNQDPLGTSVAFMRRYTDNYDVWAGPLVSDSIVVVIINWMDTPQSISFDLSDVGLDSADIVDLWTGNDLGTVDSSLTASVDAHGALIYKLSNGVQAVQRQFTTYLATAPANMLEGGAAPRAISNTVSVVGHIGYDGVLTFVNIDGGTAGGTKLVSLSYVNADYTFSNTDCSNCRRAVVNVNEGPPVDVEMPISGQSWDILFEGYLLSLDGFVSGPHNNITFWNPASAWAPDMYSIGVEV